MAEAPTSRFYLQFRLSAFQVFSRNHTYVIDSIGAVGAENELFSVSPARCGSRFSPSLEGQFMYAQHRCAIRLPIFLCLLSIGACGGGGGSSANNSGGNSPPVSTPISNADNYRTAFLKPFIGRYVGYGTDGSDPSSFVDSTPCTASVTDASISTYAHSYQLVDPRVELIVNRSADGSAALHADEPAPAGVPSDPRLVSGSWSSTGEMKKIEFINLVSGANENNVGSCSRDSRVAPGSLSGSMSLGAIAASLMQGYQGAFPPQSCVLYANGQVTGNGTRNQTAFPVSIHGNILSVGASTYDLGVADNAPGIGGTETVRISSTPLGVTNPSFDLDEMALTISYAAGTEINVNFSRKQGVKGFGALDLSGSGWQCRMPGS